MTKEEAFDMFRALYPRKVGKRVAKKKFMQMIKETHFDDIYAGLRRYMNHRYSMK